LSDVDWVGGILDEEIFFEDAATHATTQKQINN